MAGRLTVGLDIGTTSVRAVELALGKDDPKVTRIGQVALPPGAVRGGEVADPQLVADAIRRLWSTTGIRTKKVAVGVSNQRVVVRQVDLPWLPVSELRQSLALQVADLIPMPIEEAILDFHPLEEYRTDAGARMLRVLLVAAGREMVHQTVEAVRLAGLRTATVDLTPFAVLRSLYDTDGFGLDEGAEALVDVGATVTNILVHERGVPRFVRILLMGGADVTDALAERLGVPLEQAEAVKQRMGLPPRPGALQGTDPAERVVESAGAAFVEEVRSSLDFFQAQSGSPRITRLRLSGGGAQLRGLPERLSFVTRLPVEQGVAMRHLPVGKLGLSPEQVQYVEPLANVCVGLAMSAMGAA